LNLRIKENFILNIFLFIFLIVYLHTLYPAPGGRVNAGDSMKWQFIGKVFGTPHPTGYPLFIILSSLFARIPLPIQLFIKVNLISTIFAILTLFFLYKTLRLLSLKIFPSLISTSIFAFGEIFWSQATEAEVYTLNSFFISLILYLLILWKVKKDEKALSLSIFFLILSLSNHITISLFFPSVLTFILSLSPKSLFQKRTIFYLIFSLFILILLYTFLILRSNSSIYSEFPIKNLKDFIYFISGGEWKRSLGFFHLSSIKTGMIKFISSIPSNITIPSLIFFVLGIFNFFKDLRVFFLLFFSTLLFLFFPLFYSIRDVEVNYIPLYFFIVIFISSGMDLLLGLKFSKPLKKFLSLLLLSIPVFLSISNYKELKIEESYWGDWIKVVFSSFKRDTIFIPDYINYDQDMALCYGVFGLDFIKKNNFVISEHFPCRERIIEDYLEGKEISLRGFKLKKNMKIVCFDEGIALELSKKYKVEKRVLSGKVKIPYFRISIERD